MAGMQGRRISFEQVNRVKYLLAETDLTTHQIATRMGTSRSTIISINRRFDVRRYKGKRKGWEMGSNAGVQAVMSQL